MRPIQRQTEAFAYRTAAQPTKLYRGIRVNLPPELVAEMKEKLANPTTAAEAGRELELGPKILDYLSSTPWETTIGLGLHDWTGLGPHWHTDPRFAHTAAYGDLDERQQGLGKRDFPFLMTAEWDGQGQADAFGGDSIENETQVKQGTPLKITSLIYQPEMEPDGSAVKQYSPMGGGTSIELLHNPIYDRHGIPSGGPRNYTASLAERRKIAYRNVRLAYSEAHSSSPLTDDTIYGLSSEFQDWATKNNKGNPYDDQVRALSPKEFNRLYPKGKWKPRGPVGYWPNIEAFLQERYPAAHRGLSMGFEDATPLLDKGEASWLPGKAPYETGPDAIKSYGYDPKEIAAAMLILHNGSHPGRDDWVRKDQARLLDIVQKRHKMQEKFDSRPKVAAAAGDCYEAAAHYMLENAYGKKQHNLRLVHGEVAGQGPMEGKTFGHAWIEDGDTVIDRSNGRNLVLPKAAYYALGKIDRLNNTHVYTWEQARDKMLQHEVYGPWDLEGKHPNYVESPMAEPEPEEDDDDWMWDDDEDDDDVHLAHKTAMPMPPPDGLNFKYHATDGPDDLFAAPAVTAHIGDDPNYVGYLEWFPEDPNHWRNKIDPVGPDGVGEVAYIHVNPEHRRHNIGTMMYDYAKSIEPRLHHSELRSTLGNEWVNHEQRRKLDPADKVLLEAHRLLAMPAPLPEGMTFHYHPGDDTIAKDQEDHWDGFGGEKFRQRYIAPAVEARHNGNYVGHLTWYPFDRSKVERDPIVADIHVEEPYRHHSIATALFDFARQHEPRLKHSPYNTPSGKAWAEYEQGRELAEAEKAIVTARRLLADQNTGSDAGIIGFLVWCIRHHHKLDYEELTRYAQESGLPLEDFEDIRRWLDEAGNFPLREAFKLAEAQGYSTVHEKVRDEKGAPSGHTCVDCGKRADHWTYNHSSDSEKTKTNDSLPYSTNTKSYSPRCRSCHNKLDQRKANRRIAALNQDLVNRLNREFRQWWVENRGDANNPAVQDYRQYGDPDRGPIGTWPVVESFFKAKYPAAHRGLTMGLEQAQEVLDTDNRVLAEVPGNSRPSATRMVRKYETGPEAVAQYGYDPAEIAAGLLLLHNRSHPLRGDMAQDDQDRLVDIVQKRMRMQRAFDKRQQQPKPTGPSEFDLKYAPEYAKYRIDNGLAKNLDDDPEWQEKKQRVASLLRFASSLSADFLRKLKGEFDDWHGEGFDRKIGGIGTWSNVEDFLKERYPAAHRGFDMGLEEARPLLRGEPNTMAEDYPTWYEKHPRDYAADEPYETGPEAVAKHGYDPREIAAGMVLLHNKYNNSAGFFDGGRDREVAADVDLLNDIFQKRQKMQRSYEERNPDKVLDDANKVLVAAARLAMPAPTNVPTTRNQWTKERDRLDKKRDKAQVPVKIVPNFDDDWDNQVFDQNWDWEGLRGGRSSWYSTPLEYEGKGKPGIAFRSKVTRSGVPINYLIHHDDNGQINGILSHFPEGSPYEKPGSITLTVHPAQRGRGIGGRLAEEAERRWGVNLDDQEFTPLGYEMYRRIKHQRGQDVPNVFNGRTAMPAPTNVPHSRDEWASEYDKLNEKAEKAGLGVELLPNFPMGDWDFAEQVGVHDQPDVRYRGKGKPGIAYRRVVVPPEVGGFPVNYLIHHGDDGKITGILAHFPEGTPYEKPGSITVTVDPNHRGKGIGTALVQAAEKKWRRFDLDQQQFTPLGYELYRNVKHQRGIEMPDIFKDHVADDTLKAAHRLLASIPNL